jgi:gliding motility-associated-like protein
MILDGMALSMELFSSDYWFTVELGNGRNFKGHFSLKGDSFMM